MKLVVHRFQWFIPVPSTRTTGYHHQTIPKGHTISRVHGFPQPISIGLNLTRHRIDSVAITERGVKQTGDGRRGTGDGRRVTGDRGPGGSRAKKYSAWSLHPNAMNGI